MDRKGRAARNRCSPKPKTLPPAARLHGVCIGSRSHGRIRVASLALYLRGMPPAVTADQQRFLADQCTPRLEADHRRQRGTARVGLALPGLLA